MSKLVVFNMMTLDGFFEGPDHDLSWHNTDKEFDEFANEQIGEMGTMMFGRVTCEMMAEFWPSDIAAAEPPMITDMMNSSPKVVVSRTLESADWNNTTIIKGNVAEEVTKLKEASDKNPVLLGSANLMHSLALMDLIDEYRVMVNPVVLGAGTPLFKLGQNLNLSLAASRTFQSGNVLLTYRPAGR